MSTSAVAARPPFDREPASIGANELLPLIDAFAGIRVLVVGDAMLDSFLVGSGHRLSREAPVPIVDVDRRDDVPGGAANTAANARALGGQVRFLSVVGGDDEGRRLWKALEDRGLETEDVLIDPSRQTVVKHRVVAGEQILLRFDQGSTEPLSADLESSFAGRLHDAARGSDVVIVSDYASGVLTNRVLRALTELRDSGSAPLVVDARDLRRYARIRPTAVKPNYEEAVRLLGKRPVEGSAARVEQMEGLGQRLLDVTGAQIAAVSLDTEGALVFEGRGAPHRTYSRPARTSRALGAGDTFVSALALALTAGAAVPAAAELASAAASIVVSKDGTSTCSSEELRQHLLEEDKYLMELSALAQRADFLRSRGRRIVFTNGCFDILHRGHITYLNRAKALGDVLIVGINSDESVRRLKGPGRPINTLEDRLHVLAALSCIDHLVPFAADTPVDVIRTIRPDLYVKGGDYSKEQLPEASVVEELGGDVRIVPYVEDLSTTRLVSRIREAQDQGGVG